MRPKTLNYPPNPNYGADACRRRISLITERGIVRAHLSDNFHEMRCLVRHDGRTITAIEAETLRIPTSACPAAIAQLHQFVGLPVGAPAKLLYSGGQARQHCTHLLDLVVIAIRHTAREPGETTYEAQVPDETNEPVKLTITRNGVPVHEWSARDGVILEPSALAGRTLDRGFAAWASETFDEDDFEAATILSRTWLIAVGRLYRTDQAAGQPASINLQMFGRCFAYSRPQIDSAVFTGEPERNPPF